MRGAIFNSLGDIDGLSLLDAFSGSGAISFEAISRGAKNSVAIESNKQAQLDIAKNIEKLSLEGSVKLVSANLFSWASTAQQTFDIIIADPPYNKPLLNRIVELEKNLASGGVLVLSVPPSADDLIFPNLKLLSQKLYGDSKLVFYKNNL